MAGLFASLIGRRLLGLRRKGFARDDRGATAIEFGILAVPFFMIVGAILETSILFLSAQILDSSVQDVSRLIRTGQAKSMGIVDVASFKAKVCSGLFGLFTDCANKLHVEVEKVDNFGLVKISAPINQGSCNTTSCPWTRNEKFDAGSGTSYMVIQVYYKWPVVVSLGGYNMGNLNDGTRLIGASTVLRNEPYT